MVVESLRRQGAELTHKLLVFCEIHNDWEVNGFLISFVFYKGMVKGLI